MTHRHKVTFYSVLATIFAAISSISAANPLLNRIFVVLPLVLMGFFLFMAGYYAGRIKGKM